VAIVFESVFCKSNMKERASPMLLLRSTWGRGEQGVQTEDTKEGSHPTLALLESPNEECAHVQESIDTIGQAGLL